MRSFTLPLAVAFIFLLALQSLAQLHGTGGGKVDIKEGIGRTWKGPAASVFSRILARRTPPARTTAPAATRSKPAASTPKPSTGSYASIKFRPGPDTGIADMLATAFTTNADERAEISDLLKQIKQLYETEVAKEGKSNDLAAAMTFFIASNVVAYYNSDTPTDAATEDFYNSIRDIMAATPEIARLTNAEKHQTHDWLVYMGGFVLAGHMNAKQTNDRSSLNDFKLVADQSMRLILGISPSDLTPDLRNSESPQNGFTNAAPDRDAAPASTPIVGVWTAASTSPSGTALSNSAGTFRARYTFNADGTYAFKSEMWGGYTNSNTWWTTEETGSYSVAGNRLTVTPRTNRATLRNSAGAVQRTQNNPLEKVTYNWTTHYFSGINETNLVLEPPQKTNRDGPIGGSSLFPRAYLYKQGDRLAWRY